MHFSIIIPAKNESGNIDHCIRSIHDCSDYPQELYEIIVVDNGSTDNTAKIAESNGARVFVKPGLTIAALRNFGASVAKGTILVFLDADCSVKKGWLKNASSYLEREDIACFGSPPKIPDSATWVQQTWFLVRSRGNMVSEVSWLESMNMFVRRSAFEKVRGFDETLITCEDVDISYRIAAVGKIVSDPDIEAVHHGEASTVNEFFKKERWRGKSNYIGLMRHGLKLNEIPSLILPLYYGLCLLASCFCIIFKGAGATFLCLVVWQAPVLGIVFMKLTKNRIGFSRFVKLSVLYNIYYTARFVSVFG